jgi:hypothetical protein
MNVWSNVEERRFSAASSTFPKIGLQPMFGKGTTSVVPHKRH